MVSYLVYVVYFGILLGVTFHLEYETQADSFHDWLLKQFCTSNKTYTSIAEHDSSFPIDFSYGCYHLQYHWLVLQIYIQICLENFSSFYLFY